MLACSTMRGRFPVDRALRATALGTSVGVLLLVALGLVWRVAGGHLAANTAEFSLLTTLLAVAAVTTLGTPAKMRKARVPVRRAMPPQWWPQEEAGSSFLALCLGAPIIVASAAGAILFR